MKTNKNAQNGFTLIELLAVIIFLAVLGAIVGGGLLGFVVNPKSIATKSAGTYIEAVAVTGEELTLVSCLSADNDGDGKVSCTVFNPTTKDRSLILCESTIWAKIMGGSCAVPAPFTVNGGQAN